MEVVVEKYNPWKDAMLAGIILLVIGVLLMVLQGDGLKWILIIGGLLLLVLGILSIYDSFKGRFSLGLAIGVVEAVFGLVLIILPNLFADLLMVLLAIGLIIVGLMSILGMSSGFAVASGSKAISLIIGVVLVVLGVFAILNLDQTADVVMAVIGAVLAVIGVLRIYGAYRLKRVCRPSLEGVRPPHFWPVILITWYPNSVCTGPTTSPTFPAKQASSKGLTIWPFANHPRSPPLDLEGHFENLLARAAKSSPLPRRSMMLLASFSFGTRMCDARTVLTMPGQCRPRYMDSPGLRVVTALTGAEGGGAARRTY